ncbi:MBL fold metallo-hydrolase [Lacibacter sp.]|uniref:MBL fold metallo-hydrolase n=1 Tax=Lacibacter sp. TaxID=1915409 RepID=UPI002B4B5B31|nr:MBL fold metallo-hydrolase [Lacibacter sp.]HLP36187.1 MBL fold metallo-hydrolase [Lacibacter sp.]
MAQLPTHNSSLPFIKENWNGNLLNKKQQYINLDGPSERSFAELLKWQTERNPFKPLKRNQQTNIDISMNKHITGNREDGIVWLGHASFLFTLGGKHFIVDPVLYNVGPLKRFTPLPCDVAALKQIDFILLSHNHRDHADKRSMIELCTLNPSAVILTGLNIAPLLRSWRIKNPIIEAGWYQQYQLETDVQVSYLPAKHWNRRGLHDMNDMLWGSFMLQSPTQTIYFGADSGLGIHYPEIAQLFPNIDVAILGIGAYKPEWFMNTAHTSPADALVAFEQLNAKQLIPMHHGTFDLSDEPVFYPKQDLMLLQEQHNITAVQHLSIGNKMQF